MTRTTPADCPTDGVALLKITSIGNAWADEPLQVEIVVRMEPPADATPCSRKPPRATSLPPPPTARQRAMTGGNSFNDAPRLTSGTTYSDTIVTGREQVLPGSVAVGSAADLPDHRGRTGISHPWARQDPPSASDMYNPVRAGITDFLQHQRVGLVRQLPSSEHPFNASTPYPVRYTNRDGNDQDGFSLDGDYYLRVNANRHDDEPSSTTFLITVVVSGDVEAGPVYQACGSAGTAPSIDSTSTPATTSATDTSAAHQQRRQVPRTRQPSRPDRRPRSPDPLSRCGSGPWPAFSPLPPLPPC